jgi:hypothetical protein
MKMHPSRLLELTWTKLSPDHETAMSDGRLWVLTRDHMAGKRNRWNLIVLV